ncbi:MAG: Holliday junction resolvase RuvX [Candidatus Kerfeldbacteria bacterium]|nr:Holliday junction resolvase RuvX [Candidatus Kerfeldbacteria bacterium]
MAKILGLDLGEKKIGLAIGDSDHGFAFARPALLVDHWAEAWPVLKQLVQDEGITTIVLGWPTSTDGTPSDQTQRAEEFRTALAAHLAIPIVTHDERFTTQAVQREQSQSARTLDRGMEDSLAAQLILESYLQTQR